MQAREDKPKKVSAESSHAKNRGKTPPTAPEAPAQHYEEKVEVIAPAKAQKPRTLCIDVGGTGVKAIVLDQKGRATAQRERILTPRPATPAAILKVITELVGRMPAFDRVAVGFPGVVTDSTVRTAPNLDGDWSNVPLGAQIEKLSRKPTRVLNDAGVQGHGVIEGKGVEMVLTFGTGMGTALFLDGRYVPNLELAHHPLRGKKTYEETVSDAVLKHIGHKKWNKRVRAVVQQVLPIWNPRVLYLGGGNSRLIKGKLPDNVHITENIAGLFGGIKLWEHE